MKPQGLVRKRLQRGESVSRDPDAQQDSGPSGTAAQALLASALRLFADRGFHGTTMRDIALDAETSVSHVYYYYPSKADILKSMLLQIVRDLLADLRGALDEAGPGAVARLRALVIAEVRFHCERRREAFVGRAELRSLRPEDRPEVIQLYDEVTALFRRELAQGVQSGVFTDAYELEMTNAILTMCLGVSTWYREGGALTSRQIAQRYADLVLRMVRTQAAA